MRWPVRTAAMIAALSAVLAGCSQVEGGSASVAEAAASAIPTVLVLDSSGSMSESDAPGPRMAAAKKAATGLVDALPDGAMLGLVAYGTSTGGTEQEKAAGCADVTTLQRAVALDRGAVTAGIATLEPSGYTPIGASLRQAAELLPGEGEVAIVLLSDGEDTCAPPEPCDIAKELKAERPGLTISTVGFKTANEELACIARATDGLYLTADNTDQLVSRLVAAQNASGNADALTPTGLLGVELGQGIDAIQAAHPGFPGLAEGRADGTRVVVVWMECDWVFAGGVLTEIQPRGSAGATSTSGTSRTIDGLGPGSLLSEAVGLYGAPESTLANPDGTSTSLFTASEQAGTAWKVGHRDEKIEAIYLCECLPEVGATAPRGQQDQMVGATTVKRIPAYGPDGSLGSGRATAAGYDFGCKPMATGPKAEGFYGCGKYASDGAIYFCSTHDGNAFCPVLDADSFSGGPKFVTAPVVFMGDPFGAALTGELPWAIQLDDGTRCQFGSVLGPSREGKVGAYHCDGYVIVWAPDGGNAITESAKGWTVSVAAGDGPIRQAKVRVAIVLTRG